MNIEWQVLQFNQLTANQLYHIIHLRNEVFVVEQNCVFQDADFFDFQAYHIMAWHNNSLVAYARLLPPQTIYQQASIGRVVVKTTARGKNMGKLLMLHSIENAEKLFGNIPIKIGAQLYLKKFYENLGFVVCSDMYSEDGIQHIHMLR